MIEVRNAVVIKGVLPVQFSNYCRALPDEAQCKTTSKSGTTRNKKPAFAETAMAGAVGNRLFQNFSWKIKDGEHWVITGPNGRGKTTYWTNLFNSLIRCRGRI